MSHPKTPEHAIFIRYGVRLPVTASDCRFRRFKIDQFHNGFLIKTEESAIFGTILGREAWAWTPKSIESIEMEHKDHKNIKYEWLVWMAACSVIESGVRLGIEDAERLALAVSRLEAWL